MKLLNVTITLYQLHAKEEGLLVFAAASLTNFLEAIEEMYEKQTGNQVVISFAASSIFARQIDSGAPADD